MLILPCALLCPGFCLYWFPVITPAICTSDSLRLASACVTCCQSSFIFLKPSHFRSTPPEFAGYNHLSQLIFGSSICPALPPPAPHLWTPRALPSLADISSILTVISITCFLSAVKFVISIAPVCSLASASAHHNTVAYHDCL